MLRFGVGTRFWWTLGLILLLAGTCESAWSQTDKKGGVSLQADVETQAMVNATAAGSLLAKSSHVFEKENQAPAGADIDGDEIYEPDSNEEEDSTETPKQRKRRYWKVGIAFGVVVSLVSSVIFLYVQMKKKDNRYLEGGAEGIQSAPCTWLCACNSEGQPVLDHPKLRLTDDEAEEEEEKHEEEKQESEIGLLNGGGANVSLLTLAYGVIKIGWGVICILDMLDQDLVNCQLSMTMILGICAVLTAIEGALVLTWASIYTNEIRNGMRVSCFTIMFAFTFMIVHLVLNSVGTALAYSENNPAEGPSCALNIYGQVFFTSAFVIFFLDLAVLSRELGIVTKWETSPYVGLGFWST